MFWTNALLVLCSLALTVCASSPQTGNMAADWTPQAGSGIPRQKVTIAWESGTSSTGNMTFTLGRGGQRYIGSYLMIEKTASHVEVQPFYDIWDTGSFDPWSSARGDRWFEPGWGVSAWVEHYDGHVVVGLHGDRDGNARCYFTLANTEVGIPGGGTGKCQVDDGGYLDVRF